jgi:23S rRNA (adenine2030-N6)-methyltransferase
VKYRHGFHAGNFADVHKHVTLLALLAALKRKDKGFAYLETHAGRGSYDLSNPNDEAKDGIVRFIAHQHSAEELRNFADLVASYRVNKNQRASYPGSPAIAAHELRSQDRALLSEIIPTEERLLERELDGHSRIRVERGDGFERLRAWLPPIERRGLIFIDPPYEESRQDFDRATTAVVDALQRFSTGVIAVWYPIKDEREIQHWHEAFAQAVGHETLASQLWLYPRDSKVALNGSGLLIVNPPFQLEERMRQWLPELRSTLDVGHAGGTSVTKLPHRT